MKIIVGSRGSQLALTQTKLIVNELSKLNPNVDFEIKVIKTKGDKIQDIPLDKMNDKGIFVKEIEEQLISYEIDMAVHSMKDMPTKMDERLVFPVIPKREDPRDALILKNNLKLEDLSMLETMLIGTGSKRRSYQFKAFYPKAEFEPIRGNIDTRINKLHTQKLDGIILAASGLKRISRENEISHYFDEKTMVPAPCQGILALQTRTNDYQVIAVLSKVEDRCSRIQYIAERAYLEEIEGGCHAPVGAYCEINGDKITIYAVYGDEQGSKLIRDDITGATDNADELGRTLAKKMKRALEESYEKR